MLIQYVKDKSGRRVGCLVAKGRHNIGWSKVHAHKDKFDRVKAVEIAEGRADKSYKFDWDNSAPVSGVSARNLNTGHTENIHSLVALAFGPFYERVERHFKTDAV